MNREKESDNPIFDHTDRGFNVKAWYLKNTEESKGDALVEIKRNEKLLRRFLYPAYKIYNIAAHFSDIVDGELSENNKLSGYNESSRTI
jgi:hypothetical protein